MILDYGQKISNFEKVEPIKKPQLFKEILPTLSSSSPFALLFAFELLGRCGGPGKVGHPRRVKIGGGGEVHRRRRHRIDGCMHEHPWAQTLSSTYNRVLVRTQISGGGPNPCPNLVPMAFTTMGPKGTRWPPWLIVLGGWDSDNYRIRAALTVTEGKIKNTIAICKIIFVDFLFSNSRNQNNFTWNFYFLFCPAGATILWRSKRTDTHRGSYKGESAQLTRETENKIFYLKVERLLRLIFFFGQVILLCSRCLN